MLNWLKKIFKIKKIEAIYQEEQDEGSPYLYINRHAIVLVPKLAYAKRMLTVWNMDGSKDSAEQLLETLSKELVVYLVPAYEYEEDALEYVRLNHTIFLVRQLENITPEQNLWPSEVTAEFFNEWFDIRLHGPVIDVMPLE
jgi:hypothetical protein